MPAARIGIQIEPNDTFWVQLQEVIVHSLQLDGSFELVPIEVSDPLTTSLLDEHAGLVEDVLSQNLRALICKDILPFQFPALLDRQLPIIYLAETDFQHPLFVCPKGLYSTAYLVGTYLAEKIQDIGQMLCAGGMIEANADDGSSRLAGFQHALQASPGISYTHIPTAWTYELARAQIADGLAHISQPIDAIFGLSDTIALAARDALKQHELLGPDVLIAGINGDPLALAAIAEGSMTLTVETPALEMGRKVVELACQAAHGKPLPSYFSYNPTLITRENVDAVALQKLIAIADMPSRMVGVNRRQEQNRLVQLETSAEISRRVGALLDQQALFREISHLIRTNYDYDEVQIFFWSDSSQRFVRVLPAEIPGHPPRSLEEDDFLEEAVRTGTPVFVPDTRASYRFSPDPHWPMIRSRVALPIQLGGNLIGIVDLHSHKPTLHLRHELIGLQALANQLGIVMKNADLYAEALEARARAERADQLKTRLLANVSHELRTPLNVIIGYAETALSVPNPYNLNLPDNFQRDLGYIAQSGHHLLHLINDLLSLSQAEIGALELYKETLAPRTFLEEVFESMAALVNTPRITWRLHLPEQLPFLEADPVRLRQILLNLLHNASKFTHQGEIELGAEVMPPYLHLWVRDTGIGIPTEMQERIFDPFVKMEQQRQRQIGVGLGLTIVRRLVALHGGSLTLESRADHGSTFHIYMPLPDASGREFTVHPAAVDPVLLLISSDENVAPSISALCQRQKLTVHRVQFEDDVNTILTAVRPGGLAWDLTTAQPEEWNLFERLRAHPQICQLPLIIYGHETGASVGITNVILKPINEKTLVRTLMALYSPGSQRSVLLVDDAPNARALYQKLVMEALPGCPILIAESGAQALSHMKTTVPALVILDLMMPEIDGFMVLERMRANPATRYVPVIVMSGRLLTSDDVRRLDYENVVFHSKNLLSQEEALKLIQESISGGRNLSQPTSRLVKQALAYMHQNYTEAVLSREHIASAIGTSKQHLDRIFGKELGISVNDCLNRFRIERARQLLDNTSDDLTLIAMQVGFNDSAYFSRVFRKLVGYPPSAYRKQRQNRSQS
jgi:signal transduction histidine kinase/AraC-like DNA-binding protein/DNA-binding LacI/PurR family transcriptional regulator